MSYILIIYIYAYGAGQVGSYGGTYESKKVCDEAAITIELNRPKNVFDYRPKNHICVETKTGDTAK